MLFTDDKRLNALTQEVDGQSFDGYNFCLSVRRNYRNSFAPVCIGKLIPQATGTVVDVQFGMRPFVKIFLALFSWDLESYWCVSATAFVTPKKIMS